MALAAIGGFRELIEVVVTSVSILGGSMAYCGIAKGFDVGLPIALFTAIFLAAI